MAGVRVLAFPRNRLEEIDQELRKKFPDWTADPVPADDGDDEPLAFKYYGVCEASDKVKGEFQIVSMLIGLFWEVEHSAMYKPDPQLIGAKREIEMRERRGNVYQALRAFEETFENLIRSAQDHRR